MRMPENTKLKLAIVYLNAEVERQRDRADRLADVIKRARQSGDPEFPEVDDAVEMWRILGEASE